MKKPESYLSIEIGSDTQHITSILDMLPKKSENVKYYNIGDVRGRDNGIHKESFYRYRYYNKDAFDANIFVEDFLNIISLEDIKRIVSLGFDVLLVFNIFLRGDRDTLSIPDAGLSAKLMRILGDLGIDYHVNISI
jgi:hypothetical protein